MSHKTPLIVSTQPSARIENVVAVCALAIQAAPSSINRSPNARNQPHDFRTSSMPAANKLEIPFVVLLLFP